VSRALRSWWYWSISAQVVRALVVAVAIVAAFLFAGFLAHGFWDALTIGWWLYP
jgi:hypothetical protein